MKNLVRVHRFTKPDCLVSIMEDRATGKYCYVNLTSQHVCQCRFDTFEQALADMLTRENVVSFDVLKGEDIGKLIKMSLPLIKNPTIPDTCRDMKDWLEKGTI